MSDRAKRGVTLRFEASQEAGVCANGRVSILTYVLDHIATVRELGGAPAKEEGNEDADDSESDLVGATSLAPIPFTIEVHLPAGYGPLYPDSHSDKDVLGSLTKSYDAVRKDLVRCSHSVQLASWAVLVFLLFGGYLVVTGSDPTAQLTTGVFSALSVILTGYLRKTLIVSKDGAAARLAVQDKQFALLHKRLHDANRRDAAA